MINSVCKRDGSITEFNDKKIYAAISYAYSDVYGELSEEKEEEIEQITDDVVDAINFFTDTIHVETIQDIVEQEISKKDFYVAKAYITYRYKRAMARNTTDNAVMELVGGKSDYWNNENSNKDAMLATTQRDYLAGIVSTDITERMLLPKDVVEADKEGIIHFHDKDYFIEPINNCFSGSTSFITSNGVRQFKDCVDGEKVSVIDKNGNWQEAIVKQYGKQKMQIVELQSGGTVKTIKCTYNHRWVLKDGTVTTNLKIGDRLYCTPTLQNKFEIIPKYFCMGFVIGDGCDYTHSGEGVQVRLCGNKTQYVNFFLDAGYKVGQIKNNNDIVCYKKGFAYKNNFITTKAWKYLSHKELFSLFEGYYAADGFKDRNGIATSNPYLAEMIREISSVTGRYICSEKVNTRPTNYSKNRILYEFRFCKSQPSNKNWIVKNITRNDQSKYSAWCVEEPNTHTFTLDGGIVTGNCCLINLEDMLQNGTVVNKVAIEKPHRFLTAMTIATQIITAVASSQYGGTTITLTHLAPFVRDSYNYYLNKQIKRGFDSTLSKQYALEDLKKEIADGVQTFNYQINSMSTTNGQAPFISVCMYLNEDPEYTHEVAMIIEEFFHQRMLGMKNEKGVYVTQAFPKLLYVLDENNIYEDSEYYYLTELAAKCVAKRMNPDFISAKVMKELKGDVYPCMGCRSFLTPDTMPENGIGNVAKAQNYSPNKHKYYGRFNQGVVTLNLVDLALSSGKDVEKFWRLFEERTELCHKALRCRHERLLGTTTEVAPILWQHGAFARLEKGEKIDALLLNNYSTISLGYAGLYECVKYMTGVSHTDPEVGMPFGLEIMQRLNDKCAQWREAETIAYSLYGTPIESTTYKFAKKLKERFGIIPDITDHDYITNSYHINVREEINPFEKLRIESKFQELSPGGAISYIETDNLTGNIPAVLNVIKFIYDNIMYAELNTKSDYCHVCGYDGEIKIISEDDKLIWECPICKNRDKNKMNVTRRTCGYLGTNFWNQGRTEEIKDRYVHMTDHEVKE